MTFLTEVVTLVGVEPEGEGLVPLGADVIVLDTGGDQRVGRVAHLQDQVWVRGVDWG